MDFVPLVKSTVDIVNVVGDYVRLKKQGTQRYVGLCPFHNEKTPSFSVHAGLQIFKCFGCGKAGDVFQFLMELEGMSFFEALKTLADQHGIAMPKRGPEALADDQSRLRAALYRQHEIARELFTEQLASAEGKAAREYLTKRGLTSQDAAEFGLGFAPPGSRLARRLEREGFSAEQLEAGGLLVKNQDGPGYFDRFRNRLIFPIAGERGALIAFAGRALEADQQPKYLNSPESPIYKKSYTLYNLHQAREAIRKKERAVLVEGYMDVIGAWRAGVKEVVASCGTALTVEQIRMVGRHTRTVTVNFDPDTAGRNAAERSILLLLEEGLHVRVLNLPEGLDPDEFCQRHGGEAYEALLAGAPNYYFWLADRARQQHDVRSAEGRVAAFQSLMPAVNRIQNKIERVALVNDLADRLGVEPGLVLEQFRRAAAERKEPAPSIAATPALKPAEGLLLRLLLESEEARREFLPRLEQSQALEGSTAAGIVRALLALETSGGPLDVASLEARLSEAERSVLAGVIFSREEPPEIEAGRRALDALEDAGWQSGQRQLHQQIAAAEKEGNLPEALRLLETKRQRELRRRASAQVSP